MDLKENASAAVQGTADAKKLNAQNPAKGNNDKGANKAAAPEQPKPDDHKGQGEQSKEAKTEALSVMPAPVAAKPKLTIEQRLEELENLQVRKSQYMNLLGRIADLKDFELSRIEDADELQENPFSGCKLILMGSNGKQFSTTTGNLIKLTHAFLLASCLEKQTELENLIVFPAA